MIQRDKQSFCGMVFSEARLVGIEFEERVSFSRARTISLVSLDRKDRFEMGL